MVNVTANLHLLWPEFLITALAFVVLTVDFFLPRERKNALAAVSVVGLVALIVFTVVFLVDRETTPLYGGIVLVDRFALFFKVAFLALGALIILASAEFVRRYLTHPGEYYAIRIDRVKYSD